MRAVDTNVLIRLIVRDDPRQTAAAERFVESGAWVSVLAVAETMRVLGSAYKEPAENLATILELLLQNRKLTFQEPEAVAAALQLFRSRPSLCFSDCLMLELARSSGFIPLGTFDRRLSKVGGAQMP